MAACEELTGAATAPTTDMEKTVTGMEKTAIVMERTATDTARIALDMVAMEKALTKGHLIVTQVLRLTMNLSKAMVMVARMDTAMITLRLDTNALNFMVD